jgi:hypothetical protein
MVPKTIEITNPPLLEKWKKTIGFKSKDWGVKQLKTKSGACNTDAA